MIQLLFKKHLNKGRLFWTFSFLMFFSVALQAQIKNISGKVLDEYGEPLPGATLIEKGTQNGTSTDFDGLFNIKIGNNSTLVVQFVGYKTLEINNPSNDITIDLKPDLNQLEETVVIGYGSVKRKDVTGSVASVKMEKLKEAPVVNFDEALAGRVTGVQVSAGDGTPGSGMDIVIRGGNTVNGDNSPLYVLDGFIIDDFNPGLITPSDIESIDVLKDASATAIYGARGANGVIMITTKRAKEGKTKINYEARVDVNTVTKKLAVLDGYEFIKLGYEIFPNSVSSRFLNDADGNLVGDIEDYRTAPSANWQDQAFRTAFTQFHKLNISSGNSTTKFDASINYTEQEGTLLNSLYERTNGRLNLRHKVSDKMDMSMFVIYANSVQNGLSTTGTSTYSFLRNLISYAPVVNQYLDYGDSDPLQEIYDGFDFNNITSWHPILSLENEYRRYESDQFISNLSLKYKILPTLTFETKSSYNGTFRNIGTFNNSKTVYGRQQNKIDGVNARKDYQTYKNFININTLTFKKRWNKHYIDAMVGASVNIRKYTRSSVYSTDIPVYLEHLGINAMDNGTLSSARDAYGSTDTRLYSLLGRVNYTFNKKYLLTSSFRRDGSSIFAKGNRIGYFPSLALAWQADQEGFIKRAKSISQLKFKVGYGKTGNDRIPNNIIYNLLTDNLASYFIDGVELPGQTTTLGGSNPNLKWETTDQLNAGVDIGLFDDRIAATVEVYQKDTRDLLINADAAPSQGFASVWRNIGHVQNRGLEIALSTKNIQTKDFDWTTDFNISFNQNKVISLPESKPIFGQPNYFWRYSSNQFIVEEGQPLGNMIGYISDGVYQPEDFVDYDPTANTHTLKSGVPSYRSHQAGDEKYKDINGDGQITEADRTIIGNGLAKHFGGFGNTFRYKNFQLSAFFQWSYGNDILNANRLVFEEMEYAGQNQFATVKNRWTLDNQNTTMHRAGGRGFEDISSRIIEDGSFIRLKTINMSYVFPKSIIKKWNFDSLKLTASAQNLFTWTKYSGFDPEVSVYSKRSAIMPGIDYSAYPRARTISLGLNMTF